ncbi:protein indeterminate-domain 7-like isoform X2 [Hibiscus syriacus]|uniref:protein indeterminate-domain 7-like isoform X2 n=1 Tax=Hibiscus syriacus TaxID=106335 RepID=UPI0019209A4F|nr:protein indeterminate-domain 7-like isoform X2 [Hibiscus syriacus]
MKLNSDEMKDYILHHQQKQQVLEDNLSNLTSAASGEASVSSRNSAGGGGATNQLAQPQPVKRKRNQPGNPDPDAEVIAMSPKTLMATNRFVCDICNKGFQRDQNLQLHRRGHNLPWKLKQRTSKEVKKKVYICPELSCVHHDPSRALGDLTGIKKHFSRKHGEKKWKCEKCSKKYAVRSDWKAHSKTCGTREYRCDCGTLFSRRDSFITHRAFCDALAENSRAIMGESHLWVPQFNPQDMQQQQSFTNVPPWLGGFSSSSSSSIFSPTFDGNSGLPLYQQTPVVSPHMSATALLQQAAQMGATVSGKAGASTMRILPHQQTHVSAGFSGSNNNTTAVFGLNLSSRDGFIHGAPPHPCEDDHHHHHAAAATTGAPFHHPSLLQDMMNSPTDASFDDIAFTGILNSKNKNDAGNNDHHESTAIGTQVQGFTRDFLNIADASNSINTSQSQKPWQV